MRVGVIYNPVAGGGHRARVATGVEQCLSARGFEVICAETHRPGDATRLARELSSQVDALVAVGGDGTVNETINGLTEPVPLGIVPAGTANVLALELHLPRDIKGACRVIAEGNTRTLDLGQANGRRFVLMAGAGLDALTIRELDPEAKRRFKHLAFVAGGLRSYHRHHARRFPAVVDGERHEATFAVVGNSRFYGGRFGLTPKADPADGLLDVLLFDGESTLSTVAFWLGTPLHQHLHHPQVTYLRGAEILLGDPLEAASGAAQAAAPPDPEPAPRGDEPSEPKAGEESDADPRAVSELEPVWYQTDGEVAGSLPVRLGVEPHALEIFVPRARPARLFPG